MKTKQVQYAFMAHATNWWTIIEYTENGAFDYECDYESYDEAYQALQYIRWLEAVYSQPRKR